MATKPNQRPKARRWPLIWRRVVGISLYPALRPGQIVCFRSPTKIRPGQIVLAINPDATEVVKCIKKQSPNGSYLIGGLKPETAHYLIEPESIKGILFLPRASKRVINQARRLSQNPPK